MVERFAAEGWPNRRLAPETLEGYRFPMTTQREIADALSCLPTQERWDLLHRFSEELWVDWDRQIESDLKAGQLDGLLAEARADIAAGRTRPLDEVLDHPLVLESLRPASCGGSARRTQVVSAEFSKPSPSLRAIQTRR